MMLAVIFVIFTSKLIFFLSGKSQPIDLCHSFCFMNFFHPFLLIMTTVHCNKLLQIYFSLFFPHTFNFHTSVCYLVLPRHMQEVEIVQTSSTSYVQLAWLQKYFRPNLTTKKFLKHLLKSADVKRCTILILMSASKHD